MKSQFAFLCEAANITANNLFNVLGGGIATLFFPQLPVQKTLGLLLRIEYNAILESGSHKIEIRLIDSDGKDKMAPLFLDVDFPNNLRFFNFITNLNIIFDVYGLHSVEISVDRHIITSIPLQVTKLELESPKI
ncbi:MAG: hypothetical protein NC918_02445 [Candidatus Omnitrophica bacterium]|nr:hypothetical protein [Candidatus Omnitrophota bacterium]